MCSFLQRLRFIAFSNRLRGVGNTLEGNGDRTASVGDERPHDSEKTCEVDASAPVSSYKDKGDDESLTHAELLELTSSTLNAVLRGDSILSDLPADVTVEEVASQIALLQGQSVTVTLVRDDGEELNVVVAQNGTVLDLKRAIQRHVTLKLQREGRGQVKVNWRYVWRSNWLVLCHTGDKLMSDEARLADVDVRNRVKIKFVKKFSDKQRV